MPKIVFTGDILRATETGRPNQWGNIGWLSRLLSPAVQIATGESETSKVAWVMAQNNRSSDFDGAMVHAAHGLPANLASWATLFADKPNELALTYLSDFFEDTFVIAFEMSPYLRRALNLLGVRYVDFCIHPVRFMEDLMMYASSNDEGISERIASFALTEDDFRLRSTFVAGAWRRQGYIEPRTSTAALFCLQTAQDRVVIDNGKFRSVADYLPQLAALRSSVDRLYIKPHPLETNSKALGFILDNVPNVEVTEQNFYELIARREIDSVHSLSSGTSIEARYVGIRGEHLFRNYYDHLPNLAGSGPFQPLPPDFLWPDFWRTILEPAFAVTPMGGYRVAPGTGVLRKSIGEAWDFSKWV